LGKERDWRETIALIRLHFVAEGQTEETFINQVLRPHLAAMLIAADARCVQTSRRRGIIHRGGIQKYSRLKHDLTRWMSEDRNTDARFTTMIDLYGLPADFPGYTALRAVPSPLDRVIALESAFADDIDSPRFVPYLQLHEFEALIFADPSHLLDEFPAQTGAVARLREVASRFASPELMDDTPDGAPSKRIQQEIPEYQGRKVSAGPRLAGKIGLQAIRQKCPHFGRWLARLEALTDR
jgi:hypothetical protein